MIKLKELIFESVGGLNSSDIFNFYFLFTISSYHPEILKTNYGEFIQESYLTSFKNRYISLFKKLVIEQLLKYHSRKRIDPGFNVSNVNEKSSAGELETLMKQTYRSDMQRRNDVWIQICEFLTKLENSNNIKDKYIFIDRLNACIHNTGGSILGKFEDGYKLVNAYNTVHHAKSIKEYESFVDKNLRQLFNQ